MSELPAARGIAKVFGCPSDCILIPGEFNGLTPEQTAERIVRMEIALSAWILRLRAGSPSGQEGDQ